MVWQIDKLINIARTDVILIMGWIATTYIENINCLIPENKSYFRLKYLTYVNIRKSEVRYVIKKKSFKFRIYPTKKQAELINKTIGSGRFVFNYSLATQKTKES